MPKKIKITINYQRAVEVSKTIMSRLEKKLWPFNQPDLFPDATIPESVNPAHFLFYAVALDSRRESRVTYPKVRILTEHLDFSKIEELGTNHVKKIPY